MLSLDETQALFRSAVAGGAADAIEPLLQAPGDPLERLEIYRRHYRESFRRHLRGRYPTIEWLVGTDAMIELADTLLREAPPRAPSLAEYGEGLVEIVVATGDRLPPWLADVARLDWHLGCLSVAIEHPALDLSVLAAVPQEQWPDIRLGLQPGLAWLESRWPVDHLVHLRLTGTAPDQLEFAPDESFLELRGARGRFAFNRLPRADYMFRQALGGGRSLGAAAEQVLGAEAGFDLSAALARVFADRLVVSTSMQQESVHV